MENSANESLMIGTYVFIFIAALTATIFLFTQIYNYSELAYKYGKQVPKGSLITDVPAESEILVSGSELISYYFNMVKMENYGGKTNAPASEKNYELTMNIAGITEDDDYESIVKKINLNATYSLKYESYDTSTGIAEITVTEK